MALWVPKTARGAAPGREAAAALHWMERRSLPLTRLPGHLHEAAADRAFLESIIDGVLLPALGHNQQPR